MFFCRHLDASLGMSELEGVREKITDHGIDHVMIGMYESMLTYEVFESDLFMFRIGLKEGDIIVDEVIQINFCRSIFYGTALDSCPCQKILK